MKEYETKVYNESHTITEFKQKIVKGGIDILYNGIDIYVPNEYSSFRTKVNEIMHKDEGFNACHYYYSEMGYLMEALLEYANGNDRKDIRDTVRTAFDQFVLNNERRGSQDQAIYGRVALDLFEIYGENKYMEYADREYEHLLSRDTPEHGILYIDNSKGNGVDGVGIFNPFLVKYSDVLKDSSVYRFAVSQIEKWCKYGVDKSSGLAVLGYGLKSPHIKKGSLNWGRGQSWYALGLLYLKNDDFTAETQHDIYNFQNTIVDIYNENGYFSQFIGQEGIIDLSATLPLLYYLQNRGLLQLSENDLLSYSRYMDENNVMTHSSGACRYPGGPYINSGSSQRLSQAFMLKLLNEVK